VRRPLTVLLAAAAVAVAVAACGQDEPTAAGDAPTAAATSSPPDGSSATALTAGLADADGAELGTVEITFSGAGATLVVDVQGLEPGFHGFHLHEVGQCEPDSAAPADPAMTGPFLSAGGHLAAEDEDHGEHAGDLPPLLVSADGTATTTVVSDRLQESDVLDADGSAVMIHAERDNLGNIPQRYAPAGPDEMTLGTGDSGGRVGCAVVTAG